MFCPNCGAQNSREQKFCRACGMNLEQTAIVLAEQFESDRDRSLQRIDRFFNDFGKVAFGGFGAVLIIGIGFLLYTIFTKFIMTGTQVAFGVFLMLFVVFAALSLVWVIYNESRKDRRGRSFEHQEAVLAVPDTGRLLNEPSEMPIPSVVEETTDLLPTGSRTRKL